MTLQITSMADIFTIILVFLLKSFSTGLATISPSSGLKLPQVSTSSKKEMKDALKVEVLSTGILVDSAPIVSLNQFQVPDVDQRQTQPRLVEALATQRKLIAGGGQRNPAAADVREGDAHLLVLADENTPYSTLKVVMASAAQAGYVDLQMVVIGAGD